MSFDIGGFLGAIVGVIGAFLVAKWQFNKQREADIKLNKEMYLRTKFIEDIDKYIKSNKNLYFYCKTLIIDLEKYNKHENLIKLKNKFYLLAEKEIIYKNVFIPIDNVDKKALNILKFQECALETVILYRKIFEDFKGENIIKMQSDLIKLNKIIYRLLGIAVSYKMYLIEKMTTTKNEEELLEDMKFGAFLISEVNNSKKKII